MPDKQDPAGREQEPRNRSSRVAKMSELALGCFATYKSYETSQTGTQQG
jgi:hypothetical protein